MKKENQQMVVILAIATGIYGSICIRCGLSYRQLIRKLEKA